MDNKTLRQNEKKIQIGLVDFFFAEGYKIDAYVDPYTGGIYENKLENKLGLQISDKSPSPDFLLACQNLEELGYVRRIQRNPNIKLMGIWPTRLGINQYEYWKANWYKRFFLFLGDEGLNILITIITTIITLSIAWIFKLFGLGS